MEILDIKSKKELLKHKNNFYKKNIIKSFKERKNINISRVFSLENLISDDDMFLININKFTTFDGQNYNNNPLIKTSLELIKNIKLEKEKSYLYYYYQFFQPKTFSELFNISLDNNLSQLKSTTIFFPWIHKSPIKNFKAGLFGPKDITNVEHRIIRLKNLINNIEEYGYIPSNNDIITGYILLKKNDFRFLITGGHHRVAVLAALNEKKNKYNKIMVKYERKRSNIKIVSENDVDDWPAVKNEYVGSKDALELFHIVNQITSFF